MATNRKQVHKVFLELIKDYQVICFCPGCNNLLDVKKIRSYVCEDCGRTIPFEDLAFKTVASLPKC
jgi:translation initiation factor 2 beta subunit (eIF-2beta)/eIF-5